MKIDKREAVADHPVIKGVASLQKTCLGIDEFDHSGFAGTVAKVVEAETFGGEVNGAAQQIELIMS